MRSSGALKMTRLSEHDIAATKQQATQPAAVGSNRLRAIGQWTRGISSTVVVLGAVSLLTDMSSEMIAPLRMIFLVQILGTPLLVAGIIEGVAEGATSLLKITSGRLADRFSRRRELVIAGYSVSNLSKPLLAFATTWPIALGLILLDRSGKAVRGAPRDAIIADAVAPKHRGKAFGFHRGADTLGAAVGPLLALAILAWSGGSLRAVFVWALIPGMLAIGCAILFLRDRGVPQREQGRRATSSKSVPGAFSASRGAPLDALNAPGRGKRAWRELGPRFWLFMAIATVFALGNSSDAF